MLELQVTAGNPRPTTTGVDRGVDVNVQVTLPDGRTVTGEVTLLPAEDGRPEYDSWGTADNWVSGALLAELYAACETDDGLDREALRSALNEIRAAAAEEAGDPQTRSELEDIRCSVEHLAQQMANQYVGCVGCRQSRHVSAFCEHCGQCFFCLMKSEPKRIRHDEYTFVNCTCGNDTVWD